MTRGDWHIKDRVIKHGHLGDRQYDGSLSQSPVENVISVECRDRQHDEYSLFHTNIMENDIMSCTIDHFSYKDTVWQFNVIPPNRVRMDYSQYLNQLSENIIIEFMVIE